MSSSGLSAYKEMKSEMTAYKDSIQIPETQFISLLKDTELDISYFKNKVVVAHFYNHNNPNNDSIWSEINRIQSEFNKKTKRVQIVSFVLEYDNVENLELLLKTKADTTSWDIFLAKDNNINTFLNSIELDSNIAQNIFVLVDRFSIIANYYNASERSEVNNMMKHLTLLLPAKEDRKKIRFRREEDIYNN